MTTPEARPEAVAVTEEMVEAAARVFDPGIFHTIPHFVARIGMTLEQERASAKSRARAALEAAAHVRSAQDHGGEANEMIGEVERLRAHYGLDKAMPAAETIRWALDYQAECDRRSAEANAFARRQQDKLAAVSARAAKAVEVLRGLEWSASAQGPYSFGDEKYPICPACSGWKPRPGANYAHGHAPDCRLATLLSDHPAPEPGVEAGEVRRAALEEAAKVLEQMSRDYSDRTVDQWVSGEARCAWNDGAKAIRALRNPADGGRDGK